MSEEHPDNQAAEAEATETPESTAETTPKKSPAKIGPAVVFIIAALCFIVIIWFVHALWTMPEETPPPVPEPEPAVDLTNVPGRDPEILGLRIDSEKGRMFFDRGTDQTLYVKNGGECTGACLNDWVPYTASEPITEDGPLGTIERSDTGELQYTWNDRPLFWYVMDTGNTTLGEGLNGEWDIARP